MADLKKQIGQRLREYRNTKGYSIEELAHIADMNAVHLASLERGEKNFTISTLEKMVKALDISFQELFSFTEKIERPGDPLISKSIALMKRMSVDEQEYMYQTAQFLDKRLKR